MERLLKIVEGPMKGAEVALVTGTRIKVGSGADCDIVIADASLAETAFELDVSESAVTLVGSDGTTREMRPFEIHAFGTTAFALGPAEGRWEELRPAERSAPEEPSDSEPAAEPAPSAETPAASETADEASDEAEDKDSRRKTRGGAIGCLVAVLLVLAALALAWFFRHAVIARVPQLKPWVERIDGCDRKQSERTVSHEVLVAASLKELAAQHGLTYAERDGVPVLAGNFAQRTERLAIRALALAADRRCALALTDDETLASSAEALLFTVTEGSLKLVAASNRTVYVTGFAPSSASLGAVLKALRADVPWVDKIDVAEVTVGGPVPDEQKASGFAVSGVLSGAEAEKVETPVEARETAKAEPDEVPDIRISDVSGRKLPRNLFPVAGILTRPYPCVVLRDGHRVVEGGQLGDYTVVRIGADALELKQVAGGKAEWAP